MQCPSCQNTVQENARFCPFCGSVMPEDPKLVEQYTQKIRGYLADGVLEPWEVRELATLRTHLNLSEQTHRSILSNFEYVDHNTIVLETDISDVEDYRANQQCQFRIMIRNVEPYAIRRCVVRYKIVQGGEQFEIPTSAIPARSSIDYTLPFIPQRAGQYEFSGSIDVDDDHGRSYRYQFRGINFTVAAAETHVINQVEVGEGFTGVLNIGDKAQRNIEAGLNLQSMWTPVNLKPIPMRRDGVFVDASFANQFTPQSACRLTLQTAQGEFLIDICAQETVTFGRSTKKSDLQLAIEPYLPTHLYHQNLAMTKQVSGRHLSISRDSGMVQLKDLGSKKGTLRNGQPCYRLTKYPLQTGDSISVANVLQLKTQVIFDGTTHDPLSVILKRQNNLPQKYHCIVFDRVGVWPSRTSPIGELSIGEIEAPLQIQRQQGYAYLCNVSSGTVTVNGLKFHNGEAIPLSIGQHIVLTTGTLSVTDLD